MVAIVASGDEQHVLGRRDVVAGLGVAAGVGRRSQPVKPVNFRPGEVSGEASAHLMTLLIAHGLADVDVNLLAHVLREQQGHFLVLGIGVQHPPRHKAAIACFWLTPESPFNCLIILLVERSIFGRSRMTVA